MPLAKLINTGVSACRAALLRRILFYAGKNRQWAYQLGLQKSNMSEGTVTVPSTLYMYPPIAYCYCSWLFLQILTEKNENSFCFAIWDDVRQFVVDFFGCPLPPFYVTLLVAE